MAFGQDFLKGFFGTDYLKDYSHANKTFTSAGYALSPKYKFLFHVYFNLNTQEIPDLGESLSASDISTVGVLVKNIELPSYEVETDTLNQYNRKRIIQTQIKYQPINIVFHDDTSDLVRNLWYKYYSYYYKDPTQPYDGVGNQSPTNSTSSPERSANYNSRDIYTFDRTDNDWGYVGEGGRDAFGDDPIIGQGKPAFFRDIKIYGFSQHSFVSYVLINPVIKSFKHDQYDYSESGGIMEHSMTVEYETVKYYQGAIGKDGNPVRGFADPAYYDLTPSALSRPGSNNSFLGPGGLLDAGTGIIGDLQNFRQTGSLGSLASAAITAVRAGSAVQQSGGLGNAIANNIRDQIRQPQNINTAVGLGQRALGSLRQNGGITLPAFGSRAPGRDGR